MYVFLIVLLILVAQLLLLRFYFGLNSKEREYNAFVDGVPYEEQESESSRIFWTAILTSWVSPTTVWSNNIINKCSLKELNQKANLQRTHVFKHLCKCCQRRRHFEDLEENIFLQKTQAYKNRSKILFASGLATNIILFLSFIIILIFLLSTNDLNFSIEENPPISQCLQLLPNLAPGHFKMSALLLGFIF